MTVRASILGLLQVATWSIGLSLVAYCQPSQIGLGLPSHPPSMDASRANAMAELGQKLFFDKRLSADGSISCASCHQPDRAFNDGQRTSQGFNGCVGARNAPSLLNAGLMKTQFWDGRRASLEAQALDPFVNPCEHGLASQNELIRLIRVDPTYIAGFRQAFSVDLDAVEGEQVARALAGYLRTLPVGNSPFDRYYYGDDQTAISPSAKRGLTLFTGRAQCSTCHQIGKEFATFSDDQFHSLHIGLGAIENRLATITQETAKAQREGRPVNSNVVSDRDVAELGRFFVTLDPSDIGKYRTPSLRNVAVSAPYMHDGSVGTLEQVVEQEIYYRTAQSGRPLILTPSEKTDLLNFLRSLNSAAAQ